MIVGAIISAAVETGCVLVAEDLDDCSCDPGRDWVSFALLIFEVVLIVYVDYRSEKNAADAVKALKDMSAPSCKAKRDGEWVETPVREVSSRNLRRAVSPPLTLPSPLTFTSLNPTPPPNTHHPAPDLHTLCHNHADHNALRTRLFTPPPNCRHKHHASV